MEKNVPRLLSPVENTCQIRFQGWPDIGPLLLWVPEVIASATGASSVYPIGGPWIETGEGYRQEVTEEGLYGGGNCPRIDERTFECCGIQFPVDVPVRWETRIVARDKGVLFGIRLTNTGDRTIRGAGAAVCIKFLEAPWWRDSETFVISEGRVCSLERLGRDAGLPNGFQAYLLKGESCEHEFYRRFWGINESTLDLPVILSRNRETGNAVIVAADTARFLHSNLHNPCTDMMLAFGDLEPGETATRAGCVYRLEGMEEPTV